MKFRLQDREAGNFIDEFDTLAEAEEALAGFESDDRIDGCYEPDFYEIVEVNDEVSE